MGVARQSTTELDFLTFIHVSSAGMCDEATILTRPTRMTKFPVETELSLRCRCRSSGTGTVRWIKNGATVRPVNGRISLDHRKLIINSTSFADSGNYTCYVTIDKLGTAKSNKLEIWGKYNLNIVSTEWPLVSLSKRVFERNHSGSF